MIQCMIFDMDGTIADTLPLCIAAFRKSIGQLSGRCLTDREITDTFGPSEEGTIAALLPNQYDEGLALYLKYYGEMHPSMCPDPFPGILPLLSYLKQNGIKLALVTGKGEKSLAISMDVLGLKREWFDAVQTGNPLGPSKPQGIQRVLDVLSVRPGEAVYVGDAVSDIESARKVSVPVAAAVWAGTSDADRLREYRPDYLFETAQGLMEWVSGMLGR